MIVARAKKPLCALAVLALLALPGPAGAQGLDLAQPPPPAPIFESIPPSPGPGFRWVTGRWAWDGSQWRWHHGRYVSKLRYRDVYVPGHWQAHDGTGFTWVPGYMK